MNKRNTKIAKFPWIFFCTGIILLALSLLFKAYDMAVVSCIPLIGSFGLFAYGCYLDKNEREFYELREKKERIERRAQWLSGFQLTSSLVGILCWIAGFFLFNHQPIWFLSCLVFAVTSFVLGFFAGRFRKTVKKIEESENESANR